MIGFVAMTIPVELWSLSLAYAGFSSMSGEWLFLSSAINTALDEVWLASVADRRSIVVSDDELSVLMSRRATKKILLALSRAPAETRNAVVTLASFGKPSVDKKLVRHNLYGPRFWETVRTLSRLQRIDNNFGQKHFFCSNIIDLSSLKYLISIGNNFLRDATVMSSLETVSVDEESNVSGLLKLSASVESIGTSFLRGVSLAEVDLSATQIEIAATGFLFSTRVRKLHLPCTLGKIVDHFAIQSSLKVVDLRHTCVTSIGKWFCEQSLVEEVYFPRTLTIVGDYCLYRSKVRVCDLEHTQVTSIGTHFLGQSLAETVSLPSTLTSLGVHSLSGSKISTLDLSRTSLTELPESSCVLNQTISIKLAPTIRTIGNNWLVFPTAQPPPPYYLLPASATPSAAVVLDLRDSAIRTIRSWFCCDRPLTDIFLPDSLYDIGHQFLNGTRLTKLDLRSTIVTHIGRYFLRYSPVVEVLLPSTVQTIDSFFLQGTMVRKLDLSHTVIITIGSSCLKDSPIEEVLCPTTLCALGVEYPECMATAAALLKNNWR